MNSDIVYDDHQPLSRKRKSSTTASSSTNGKHQKTIHLSNVIVECGL